MLYIVNEVITRKNRLRTSQIHAWGQYVRPWAKRIHGYFWMKQEAESSS